MLILKAPLTPRRRANLAKLADYLESLPEDYTHFSMDDFYSHHGVCSLVDALDNETRDAVNSQDEAPEYLAELTLYANSIETFLGNCGTVACAIGHGPAAGIPLAKSHIQTRKIAGVSVVTGVKFDAYSLNFTSGEESPEWEFLFGGDWQNIDDHHWGAAARIRFLLEHGGQPTEEYRGDLDPMEFESMVPLYKPFRVDQRETAVAA